MKKKRNSETIQNYSKATKETLNFSLEIYKPSR